MKTNDELEQLSEHMRSISSTVRRIHPEAATPVTVEHLKVLVVKLTSHCEHLARVLADITDRMSQLEETLHVRHHPRRPDPSGNPEGK